MEQTTKKRINWGVLSAFILGFPSSLAVLVNLSNDTDVNDETAKHYIMGQLQAQVAYQEKNISSLENGIELLKMKLVHMDYRLDNQPTIEDLFGETSSAAPEDDYDSEPELAFSMPLTDSIPAGIDSLGASISFKKKLNVEPTVEPTLVSSTEKNLNQQLETLIGTKGNYPEGWIHLGEWDNSTDTWEDTALHSVQGKHTLPKVGDILSLSRPVSIHMGIPTKWLQRKLKTVFPHVVILNTEIEILEIDHEVGLAENTWARIRIL